MKHAVVTGGAKGIGLGVVRELTADGWHCSILDADAASRLDRHQARDLLLMAAGRYAGLLQVHSLTLDSR